MTTPDSAAALRVAIQQTALPAYRTPVFRRLAAEPGRQFVLYYGSEEPALKNVTPEGFEGIEEAFVRLPALAGQQLFWHATQWRLASGKQADVLILGWNIRYLSLLPALIRARLAGVPVALWGHGFSKRASRLRTFLRNFPARLASAVIVYDQQTAAQLIADGLPAQKVFTAPNGLDYKAIQLAREVVLESADRAEWRRRKSLGEGPVLVHLGRLYAENRLDVAIRALPALARRFPAIRLVVIGKGDDEQNRLEAIARQAGVADLMTWVGPVYDEAALAPWLIAADLLVYPGNVGLSLIHGFNYALPAVVCAPRSAHNPEIVALTDGVNGALASELTPDALAASIGTILADPSAKNAMSAAALQCVSDTYNLDSMVGGFNDLIDYLAAQRTRP